MTNPLFNATQPQAFILDMKDVWRELTAGSSMGIVTDNNVVYEIIRQLVKGLHADVRVYLSRLTVLPDYKLMALASSSPAMIDQIEGSASLNAELQNSVHAAGFVFYMRCKELGLLQNAYDDGELPYFLHHVTSTYAVLYLAPDSKLP